MSKIKKALEKAKKERKGEDRAFIPEIEKPARPALVPVKDKVLERREVHVDYSTTEIQPIDHQIFKKNKIISLFNEYEITDQFGLLRTQVLNKLKEIGGNSLLITSANPSEGKTFLSINLGVSIAQQLDRTVLLVDVDLRHPTKNHYDFAMDFFSVKVNQGLADYLLGNVEISEIIVNPGIQKLTILPSGRPLPNAAELLSSPKMELLIEEMKARYGSERIIIFDGPAALKYTDALILSHHVDCILIVAEEERTTTEDIQKLMKQFQGKPIVGTVFNKAKSKA